MRHFRTGVLLTGLFWLATACAASGPALTENVGAIRSGATAARQQATVTFASANALARQQGIERKVRLAEKILRETDFPAAVPASAAREWDAAFAILDAYGAALQDLVAPDRATETGAAIAGLGASLNRPNINARVPAGLAAIFQGFGQALVLAEAEGTATEVMRATDPAFSQVVGGMATAIGAPEEPGSLANTVWSQWQNSVLPLLEQEYRQLEANDLVGRRRVAQAYVKAMEQRDSQLSDLILLQQSLLALGEAHAAAARGTPADALVWVDRINGWADDVRTRLDEEDQKTEGQQ